MQKREIKNNGKKRWKYEIMQRKKWEIYNKVKKKKKRKQAIMPPQNFFFLKQTIMEKEKKEIDNNAKNGKQTIIQERTNTQ